MSDNPQPQHDDQLMLFSIIQILGLDFVLDRSPN